MQMYKLYFMLTKLFFSATPFSFYALQCFNIER